MLDSLLYQSDSYKYSHYLQFPKDTKKLFYYMEPRVDVPVMCYGLGAILHKHFTRVPTYRQVREAAAFFKDHGEPFNIDGWNYIANLGYLPLLVRSVPEGTVVPGRSPITTMVNTDPKCYWLPGFMETLLLQQWYPTTAATISMQCKAIIKKSLELTGDVAGLPFKLHDFGFRGCSSVESAGIYGAAHLVNFEGTDNVPGIRHAQHYHNTKDMLGFSIPAAEHSTVITWGKARESEAYRTMIDTFGGKGKIVAVVSDSYDLNNAVANIWGKELKSHVLENGCTLVIRPDSGEPAVVVLRTLMQLEKAFGAEVNEKGYKVLHNSVRVIQGDGISSPDDIDFILKHINGAGFSTDNLTFGMGGGLAQKYDRDTLGFAIKCSTRYNGKEWIGCSKNPLDGPQKKSKEGYLDLTKEMETVSLPDDKRLPSSILQPMFMDGWIRSGEDFSIVRARARKYFV